MKVTLTIRLTITNNNNNINNKRLMSLLMPLDFNIGNVFLFVKKKVNFGKELAVTFYTNFMNFKLVFLLGSALILK